MTFSVWFEGVDQLNTLAVAMTTDATRIGARVAAVTRISAFNIEATAKGFCPVRTGNLRNSITTEFSGDGRGAAMQAEIGPEASYAPYVEWGTSRMAPHAFMGPALDRHSGEFERGVAWAASAIG